MSQRNVVIAVDQSSAAKNALDWAVDSFCTSKNDTLHLVHAYKPLAPTVGPHYENFPTAEEQKAVKQKHEQIISEFAKVAEKAINGKCNYKTQLVVGDPREVILDVADKQNAAAVVVGSRGLGAVKRVLLGSVSSHLAQFSKRPLVIVNPTEPVPPPGAMK